MNDQKQDKLRPLYIALAAENPEDVRQEGVKLLQDIRLQMSQLSREVKLIQHLSARCGVIVEFPKVRLR